MENKQAVNTCKRIRAGLYSVMNKYFGAEAGWLRGHISHCPRCQKRLIASGKVHLALSFMKTQPHRLDLLMRANQQTIAVLKHRLRQEPKAQELKTKQSEPKPLEKYRRYGFSFGSLAACLAILILIKIGIFSSMDTVQNKGRKVMKQYYARNIGRDLADDVFPVEKESSDHTRGKATA
jgi:hypothetical protein